MALKNYKIRTDTTRFVLPQLGYSLKEIDTEHFVNAYTWTNLAIESQLLALVYTEKNPVLENDFNLTIYHSDNYIVYFATFNNMTEFLTKFIKGKYSKFTVEEKLKVLKFWNLTKHSRLSNILFPKDYVHEIHHDTALLFSYGEIWLPPNTLKETFNLT